MKVTAWSAEDDAVLRLKYPSSGTDIPELRTKYTQRQIRGRAGKLNLVREGFSRNGYSNATPIVYNGLEYETAKQACDAAGLSYATLMTYVSKQGRSAQCVFDAMLNRSTKTRKISEFIDLHGIRDFPSEFVSLADACRARGVETYLVSARLKKGYSFEEAVLDAKSVGPRVSRTTAEEHGLPIVVNGVTCTTLKMVADAIGITGSALSSFLRRHECTVVEAVAYYQESGVRVTGRCPTDIEATHVAYIGTDNKKYSYVLCSVCKKVLLLCADEILRFEHGAVCETHSIPESFVLPSTLAKLHHVYPSTQERCQSESVKT